MLCTLIMSRLAETERYVALILSQVIVGIVLTFVTALDVDDFD
jgi:hypothetical protein